MYKRILVATDGSKLSKKAVASAIGLAASCKAELLAIQVVPPYPIAYFEGGMAVDSQEIKRVEALWAHKAQAVLDLVKKAAATKGVAVRTLVSKSDMVSQAIIHAADKNDCDLIVMASHGRRGIKRLLLGSETQHVLTHSSTPVLVLR
jgi:nucleotide-binding universal stress UspA family protein